MVKTGGCMLHVGSRDIEAGSSLAGRNLHTSCTRILNHPPRGAGSEGGYKGMRTVVSACMCALYTNFFVIIILLIYADI